jgi:hypothetical protein
MGGCGLGLAAQQAIGYAITPQTKRNEPSTSAIRHWPNIGHRIGGIDRPSSETLLSVVPEFSADATSKTADLFEIMKLQRSLAQPTPRVTDEGIILLLRSLPTSNASVVSPNIIMLTVQYLPF